VVDARHVAALIGRLATERSASATAPFEECAAARDARVGNRRGEVAACRSLGSGALKK
jgi:hypothetical protein